MSQIVRVNFAAIYDLERITRRTLSSWLGAFVFWVMSLVALGAQNTSEPLVVPFTSIPPFMEVNTIGERSGFIVELSELIGAEIGVPIEYLEVANSREFVSAQVSGQTHMIAGILQLPPLMDTNAFSDQVALDELRPAVLAENLLEFGPDGLEGRRVAVVPPAAGSGHAFLQDKFPVEFDTPQTALMELLARHVDAVLLPPPVVYGLAREAGVDGRIAFYGEPLQVASRHVALHESRSELMGPINDAIALLEADGRLAELRRRFNITVPPPPADVLTVGIAHVPPLSSVDENGKFSGFSVEAMTVLAARAGLNIEYKALPLSEWVKGPDAADVDMIAVLVENPQRLTQMDFTYPIFERTLAVVVRAEYQSDIETLADLSGQRVGVIGGSIFESRARAIGTFPITGYATNEEMVAAEAAGEIDMFISPVGIAKTTLRNVGMSDAFKIVELPTATIESSVALRFGLGSVRDSLNGVIPGYLLSDDYRELRQKYFGAPIFWTKARIQGALGLAGAGILALLGLIIWQRFNQRRLAFEQQEQTLAQEQSHSKALSKIVDELERSNRELDEFAYIASHDLKEPLRGIGINANFILREKLTDSVRARALRMSELSQRMEQLISDLLFFSRLDRGDEVRVKVQPRQIIDAIRSELSEWLDESKGEIVQVSEIPMLQAERVKVKTVLQNLIVNGIKFNKSKEKRVEIGFLKTAQVDGQVLTDAIFVRDNGIGIDDGLHDKVFRIFSRLNKRAEYGGLGTGSGLAFVRKIVEEHGGTVVLTSKPGNGSTFFVTLPLAAPNEL